MFCRPTLQVALMTFVGGHLEINHEYVFQRMFIFIVTGKSAMSIAIHVVSN